LTRGQDQSASGKPGAVDPAIDGHATRHADYALSQKRGKTIEEPFGWARTVGGRAQTVYRGLERARARMATCNLAQLPRLLAA
jgi:hypothetical protein